MFLLFLLVSLFCSYSGLEGHNIAPNTPDGYCAFCDTSVLEAQTFYEDDLVLALYTHKPVYPGHSLIIPKRHVSRFEQLSKEEMVQMQETIKKVHKAASEVFGTHSYLLLQKNGEEVGQSVPHVHFHYIPRKTGETSRLTFMAAMFIADAKSPMNQKEMNSVIGKMREAM